MTEHIFDIGEVKDVFSVDNWKEKSSLLMGDVGLPVEVILCELLPFVGDCDIKKALFEIS